MYARSASFPIIQRSVRSYLNGCRTVITTQFVIYVKTLWIKDLVRLCCLDIFHIACLDDICNRLPSHTAPAGYACPTCNAPVIPPDNVTTTIAETIRSTFVHSTWAQNILPKKGFPSADHPGQVLSPTEVKQSSVYSVTPGSVESIPVCRQATLGADQMESLRMECLRSPSGKLPSC
ncbi:hypothetical protein BC829DRAFT_2756 [Chytridium lagenaria]|nr:hypothetical protein BC829DRAFT_2756 [Chytridium lagenaria]